MRIWITGGAGFIGSLLSKKFIEQGVEVISIDLRPSRVGGVTSLIADIGADAKASIDALRAAPAPDVVINLAGAPIFQRWTSRARKEILESRRNATRCIASLIEDGTIAPRHFISASATGAFGERGEDEVHGGDVFPPEGESFLADVCRVWESEALRALPKNSVTLVRQGIVFGTGGMLAVLRPFFSIGLGGSIGNGKQWMPWIHIDDLVSLYYALVMEDGRQVGVQTTVLACSPNPVRNKEFSKAYAQALHRPCLFRIPIIALALRYGGLAREISYSQRVVGGEGFPAGFTCQFPTVQGALENIVSK